MTDTARLTSERDSARIERDEAERSADRLRAQLTASRGQVDTMLVENDELATTISSLRAENEALRAEIQHERDHSKMLSEANSALWVEKRAVEDYCAKVRGELTAMIDRLSHVTALAREACELAEEGWSYASEYFRDKHECANRINDVRAELGKETP